MQLHTLGASYEKLGGKSLESIHDTWRKSRRDGPKNIIRIKPRVKVLAFVNLMRNKTKRKIYMCMGIAQLNI